MKLLAELPRKVLGEKLKDGWYGVKKITTDVDIWETFWQLVNVAGKYAEAEWLLMRAGRPWTSGGTCFDTRKTCPEPGFHLRLTRECWDGGEDKNQYYTYWDGRGFSATENGLKEALLAANEATMKEDVREVLLEISWRDYLPGDKDKYCTPILDWKRED